jgi:flagellar motor switch protein FliN
MDRFERYAFSKDGHVVIIEVGLKEPAGADSGIDFRWPGGAGRIPPADLQKLEALDYGHRLAAAAVEGFDSLFSLKLERQEPLPAAGPAGMRCISSVCFAGDATGIVSLHVGHELSRLMAANRLVREPGEIEGAGEAGEMLAAWGHIVGGSLKSALADAGLRCALSMPFFTVGSDFQIESLGLDRFERLGFRCDRHFAWVEMGLKICDRMPAGAHPAPAAVPQDPFQAEAGPSASQVLRSAPEDLGLGLLLDIPLELTVELGRTKMPIHELLKLRPGSAVKLARLEGEPVDILANDVLIARGEVVVRQEKYGIRITEITSRMERLRGLK